MRENPSADAQTENASAKTDESTAERDAEIPLETTVDLTPQKTGLLQQLRADLDVVGGFYEIFDNSLDAYERVRGGAGDLKLEVEMMEGDNGEELIIRDDAGGVPPEELKVFFSLGSRAGNGGTSSVQRGAYGVGVKKATLRLAEEVTFVTRHIGQDGENDTGYGFTITKDWLEDESEWEVEREHYDIEPGTSEIRLRKLRFDWDDYAEEIRNGLESTYRRQIGGGPFTEDYDVKILFNGSELEPPEPINWAFPAFDELYPREFVTSVEPDGLDEPIELRVTVGLFAERDAEKTGTDLYIQNRLIHEARMDEQGGYGVPEALGEFNVAQHGRFKLCLSLESEADAAELPWNTTKDRLFPEHDMMEPVWNKVRRFADRYFNATFANVPAAYLEFPADHDYSVNDGKVEGPLDYHTRDRVTHKPDKGYPDVTFVEATAEAHAKLGIQRPEFFDDDDRITREQKREVYLKRLGKLFEGEFEPGTDVLSAPIEVKAVLPDFSEIDVDLTIEEVKSEAEEHAELGVRFTGHEAWKEPLYEAWLNVFTDGGTAMLEPVDERPDTPSDDDDGGAGETGDDILDDPEMIEQGFSFAEHERETVAEVFGLSEDMTAEERGTRLATAADRLRELGVSLSLE